ncbi:glycosyltransferase 87 family protein [Acrocarpospora phusangensis]|uniref:glycosyltransferase 87 family protein n=1 Tax=Acrocarpospora phusangensis TaxID=1070424 RepID=UPI001EF28DF7|nr:glycosyltransferase 87 family protein [Acrocarpospora phusangensis]
MRLSLWCVAGSLLLTITIALLGPSAMVPGLPGPSWQPPYSLGVQPDGHLVIALAAAALALGAIGLLTGLSRAAAAPEPRRLLITGGTVAAVLAFLPPFGSADHLNYAAYGWLATHGFDPYVTVPADIPLSWVEEWTNTPSVYGPVATAAQALATWLGGSVRMTVFLLALLNAAAFIATACLLHRATRHDPVRQRRAALLWTVNPLVVYHLSAGMHVDTLAIVFMIAALAVTPPVRRGILLGLGVAVKVTVGLVALGPAWESRRNLPRLALLAGVATATAGLAYALAGPHAFDQILNASKSISWATPWKLVQYGLQGLFGPGAYRIWIQIASLLLLVGLAWGLVRRLGQDAAAVSLACVAAWLFATPYALPWYDGLAFALLALVPATALDGFLAVRLAVFSFAYLPARQAQQPADLDWLVDVVRARLVPWTLLALTVALGVWAWRGAGRVPTPPGSAAPLPSAPSPESRSPSR